MTLRIPGLPNLHSHAFQRAMAGLTERRGPGDDSFWTWREWMYRFAARITPEQLRDIATQLYVEMLEAGYTGVCEFHYLHHQADGRPYADPTAMSLALIEAARTAGIRLTLLPVLYQRGGFDGRALNERQRRFHHDSDGFLRLIQTLRAQEDEQLRVGIALHSLRAVGEEAIRTVVDDPLAGDRPIHIHIAEQTAEVEDCLAVHGQRPVAFLHSRFEMDARWCLVHATHVEAAELDAIAASQATVAVCTTTEANLGDGFFPLREFLDRGGRFGVGSDSNTSVSPVEELRWLEYSQRLQHRRRCLSADSQMPSTGEALWTRALAGGRAASGQGDDRDVLTLNEAQRYFAGLDPASPYDGLLFAGNTALIDRVEVAGRVVVTEGRHPSRDAIRDRYKAVMRALLQDA